jgi:hypothetical protein
MLHVDFVLFKESTNRSITGIIICIIGSVCLTFSIPCSPFLLDKPQSHTIVVLKVFLWSFSSSITNIFVMLFNKWKAHRSLCSFSNSFPGNRSPCFLYKVFTICRLKPVPGIPSLLPSSIECVKKFVLIFFRSSMPWSTTWILCCSSRCNI